jgi:predicted nucleic acid-binding protein
VLFLLDKSAHELARRHPDARRTFETMAVTGMLATCAIVELEILNAARNPVDHRRLKTYLRQQRVWLETTDDTLSAAVDLQEAILAAGMHRKPIPDLIIAAVAQAHHAVLVHHDRDFDDIATVAADLRTRWIVSPHPGDQ